MEDNKKDKISIANILAIAALATIGVLTFFGSLLHSNDGKPGGAIIWAVVIVAVLGFLLFMSIKAKKAPDNPDKWKYVEWSSLALYAVAAILFSSSFNRFFYIVSEKENLQHSARADIKAIKDVRLAYESQQRTALNNAAEQLENYLASKQSDSDALSEYASSISYDVSGWAKKAESIVKLPIDKELKELEHRVEDWNMMDLPSLAIQIKNKVESTHADLEEKINQYGERNKLIPVISGGGRSKYRLESQYYRFDLGEKAKAQFAPALQVANGSSLLGWFLYIILNLLVILNYLVTTRSYIVGPRKNTTSGGVTL